MGRTGTSSGAMVMRDSHQVPGRSVTYEAMIYQPVKASERHCFMAESGHMSEEGGLAVMCQGLTFAVPE